MPPTKYDSTVMLIDEDVKGKDVAIKEDVDSLGGSTGGDKSASPAPNSRKKLWIGLGVTAGVLALAGIAAGIAVGVTNSKNASAASSTTPGVPTFGEQDDALKTVPVTPLPTNATSLFPCDASYSQPIYSRNADDMAWVTNDLVTRPNCSAQLLISGNAYGMSPDKQDNWFEFSQAIAACRRSNVPCRVVVERGGTYKFSQERAVNFENLTDFTLDLKPPAGQPKVTLAFVRLARISHLLHVNNCTRCEFRNFDVDWQWDRWPLASLVRMAGIRNDGLELDLEFFQYAKSNSSSGGARRSRFEIRQQQVTAQPFDPKKIAGYRSLHLVDQTNYNMAIRDGTEYFSINSQFDTITPQPNSNVITLKLKSALTPALQQGSIYLIRHFVYTGHAFTVALCQHCTFTEINIWSAPGKGMTMKDDCEHLAFTKMRITRPDTPFAATGQPRPISVTADGIFFEKTRGKIIISDVEVGWNGDDCVNNHDSIWGNYGITRTGSNSLLIPAKIVQGPDVIGGSSDGGSGGSVSVPLPNDSNWPPQNTDPDFMVGDKIQLRKGDLSAWLSTTVTSAKNGKTGWELGTADALPDADLTSSVLVNERRSGGKFLVRGMTCHDNRARGILLQVGDSMVVNSTFRNIAQPGIMIHGDAGVNEGTGVRNAIIKDNLFDRCDIDWLYKQGCILVRAAGSGSTYTPLARFHSNLTITGNTLVDMPGWAMHLANVADSVVQNNVIVNPDPAAPETDERGKIWSDTSSGVKIKDNVWRKSVYAKVFSAGGAVGEKELVTHAASAAGIEISGNTVTV